MTNNNQQWAIYQGSLRYFLIQAKPAAFSNLMFLLFLLFSVQYLQNNSAKDGSLTQIVPMILKSAIYSLQEGFKGGCKK